MNERIKQLAENAGFILWGKESWNPGDVVDWSSRYDDELQKFAELIVKECVKIAYQNDVAKFTRDGYVIGQEIEKHFGVEK